MRKVLPLNFMFKLFVQVFPVSYTKTMKHAFATDGKTNNSIIQVSFSTITGWMIKSVHNSKLCTPFLSGRTTFVTEIISNYCSLKLILD